MKEERTRMPCLGKGQYGLPNWLLLHLKYYQAHEPSRERILTRLSRMQRVLDGRNKSLSLGRGLYLAQNPGETHDLNWPD
jgi:hypothetical protein